ncbi:MAG: cytochrome ubiquinol oxidase subunit I, partial [Nitrospirota bacterium]
MKKKNISLIYIFTSLLVLGLTISAYAAAQSDIPEVEITFPYIGNRVAIWIISEIHLLFGAFILGTPIFIVVCEYIGMRTKDMRYERLAKEVTKVTLLCYAFTVLFGGMFAMFL